MSAIGDRRPSKAQHGSPMERARAFIWERRRKKEDRVGAVAGPAVEAAAGALDSSGIKPLAQRVRESKPWRRLLQAVKNRTKAGVHKRPPAAQEAPVVAMDKRVGEQNAPVASLAAVKASVGVDSSGDALPAEGVASDEEEDPELRELIALQATIGVAQAHLGPRPSTPPLSAPRRRERRHSIVGLAAAPRGQQEPTRRGSLDGRRLATNPQDRPEDLLDVLSYALEQFAEAILKKCKTQLWAKSLNFLLLKASRRGLDLDLWLAEEIVKREGQGDILGRPLFVWMIKECSLDSVRPFFSPQQWNRDEAFQSACTGIVQQLENIQREFQGDVASNHYSLIWVDSYLRQFRSNDPVLIFNFVDSLIGGVGCVTEQRNHERLKNIVLESRDGLKLRALLRCRNLGDKALGDLFSKICGLDVGHKTRAFLLSKIVEKKDAPLELKWALARADEHEHGQWEWIRSIIHTGLIPFWTRLVMNIRLFFHDIFG